MASIPGCRAGPCRVLLRSMARARSPIRRRASPLLSLSQAIAQKRGVIHSRLMRSDLGEPDRIDGRDFQDEKHIAAEAYHFAPVARLHRCFLFRREAAAVENALLVPLEGFPIGGIAQAHGHLVDAIAAQCALAVE